MSDSLAFLISDVARDMRRRFDERARLLGVTRAQWKMLFTLSREEGLNQGTLAERIEVEPITACRMIDRLTETGLLERRSDPADRRVWRIYLTDQAGPVVAQLNALAEELFENALHGVSPAQQEQLAAALGAIQNNLNTRTVAEEANHG